MNSRLPVEQSPYDTRNGKHGSLKHEYERDPLVVVYGILASHNQICRNGRLIRRNEIGGCDPTDQSGIFHLSTGEFVRCPTGHRFANKLTPEDNQSAQHQNGRGVRMIYAVHKIVITTTFTTTKLDTDPGETVQHTGLEHDAQTGIRTGRNEVEHAASLCPAGVPVSRSQFRRLRLWISANPFSFRMCKHLCPSMQV